MNEALTHSGRTVYACATIYTHKWAYMILSVIIFLITTVLLAFAGIIPDAQPTISSSASVVPAVTFTSTPVVSAHVVPLKVHTENPIRIVIPSVGVSASVSNPNTTNAKILDKELLSGAVRYPHSALLGERGNVILFGHSSYLPVVWNPAYKTFDGVQNLHKGARVLAYSSTTVYEYAVDSVEKKNTTTGAINLSVTGKILTLATCNVFGKKSDRFIVTAHFVKSYPIGNNS